MLIKKCALKLGYCLSLVCIGSIAGPSLSCFAQKQSIEFSPVAYVNPYMGNISHLLVPTYPTVHLPNSLLRVYPERSDFTSDRIHGLPIVVTSHRGSSAFNLSPVQGNAKIEQPVMDYSYDDEKVTPFSYHVYLDEDDISVEFGVSHQSAIYGFNFKGAAARSLLFNSRNGHLQWDGNSLSGSQEIGNNTKVYIYAEPNVKPMAIQGLKSGQLFPANTVKGEDACLLLSFNKNQSDIKVRYGISFISEEQAKANLRREIKNFDLKSVIGRGKKIWNDVLGKIKVEGGTKNEKHIFYTSLYRAFERPVNISEDGKYFSAFDGKIHNDNGQPFFTDDWTWDSYRAHHPLNVLIDPEKESYVLNSFVRMAEQMSAYWLPTFPEINGDSRRMNSNHGVASILDAYEKGIRGFDLEKAYKAAKGALTEKTLAPWSAKPKGKLEEFFTKNGYIPALRPEERETIPEVHSFEKRQPVAVTLGTSYDLWCLSKLAKILGYEDDYALFSKQAFNYRNLFNEKTKFFHPKDSSGKFIEPFDYVFSGGLGAREYYGENNAWIYRWDVQHNINDLIQLMGGSRQFVGYLDEMFNASLGTAKFAFYSQLPDHTGNVGQYSMANEPSLHIPYLYNFAGQPWKTQKRIRILINQWFRNDLMGVPGDEDGGGLSSFVVFSQLGFYPVTPGNPTYTIGTPFFEKATIKLKSGKEFVIVAKGTSDTNKYIQSAKINGVELTKPWLDHKQIVNGGKLEFVMGPKANKNWGIRSNHQ